MKASIIFDWRMKSILRFELKNWRYWHSKVWLQNFSVISFWIVMIVIGVDLIKAGCGSGSEWLARHSIIMWLYVSRSVLCYKSLFRTFSGVHHSTWRNEPGTDGRQTGRNYHQNLPWGKTLPLKNCDCSSRFWRSTTVLQVISFSQLRLTKQH